MVVSILTILLRVPKMTVATIKIRDRVVSVDVHVLADVLALMYDGSKDRPREEVENDCIDLYNALFYPGRDRDSGCVEIVEKGTYPANSAHNGWVW